MRLHVRLNHGHPFPVQVEPGDAVAKVKEAIQGKIGIPPKEQRLYFAEQSLPDGCKLEDCGVGGNCTLLLFRVAPWGFRSDHGPGGEKADGQDAHGPGAGDEDAESADGELEVSVTNMAGTVLLAGRMSGTRTIAQVKGDLRRKLGWPVLEQRVTGTEARVYRDDELLRDVAAGFAAVNLQAVRIDPNRARLLQDLAQGKRALRQLPAEMAADPQVVVAAICGGSATFASAPDAVRIDREAALEVMQHRGALYTELPKRLRADPKVALAAIECSRDGSLLRAAPAELRGDRQFMQQAVSWAGAALRYASPRLQAERPVVLAAVANDGMALRHASPTLRQDPVVQRTAAGNSARVLMQMIDL